MEFFKNFDFKNVPVLKIIGIVLLVIVLGAVVVSLVGAGLNSARGKPYNGDNYGVGGGYAEPSGVPEFAGKRVYDGAYTDELYPIPPPTTGQQYVPGTDAESFEITEYTAYIKTARLEKVCGNVEALKARKEVIFQDSRRFNHGCSYVFKVANDKAGEIRKEIEALKPETFQESVETIKPQLDDQLTQEQILNRKLVSIEETLVMAQKAYDEVGRLATRAQNVDSLAKIIDSKLNLIRQLTQERIAIREQLDRIAKAKSDLLDRLNYTVFHVNIDEVVIVDLKVLKDSWMNELRNTVFTINMIIQDVSTGLVTYLLRIIQIAVYLVIALLVIKYGWRSGKYLWLK